MRIALDAMGGDLAPKATVEGAVAAARDFGIEIVLVGDLDLLTRELTEHKTDGLKITVEHAPESVAMDESPMESVLTKPHSSIHVGLEMVKRGDASAFVSAGNSGAVMAAAMMILGTLPGVDRPAIASLVPASDGFALLIDAGANTEVKPVNLAQFAVMGSVYCASRARRAQSPRRHPGQWRGRVQGHRPDARRGRDARRDARVGRLHRLRRGPRHQPRQGRRGGDRRLHRQRRAQDDGGLRVFSAGQPARRVSALPSAVSLTCWCASAWARSASAWIRPNMAARRFWGSAESRSSRTARPIRAPSATRSAPPPTRRWSSASTPRSSRCSRATSPRCRPSPRARAFARCWIGCASGCIAIPARALRRSALGASFIRRPRRRIRRL